MSRSLRPTRMRVAFTVLISVMTVGACGADDLPDETRESVTVADDGPDPGGGVDGPVMYARRVDGEQDSMAAKIIGTLELDGDCLYLSDNGSRFLVLWEYGATWDESTSSVVRADGTPLPVGSELDAGGGYVSIDDLISNDVVVQLARQCAKEPMIDIAIIS